MTSQFLAPVLREGDEEEVEQTLRPRQLGDFVGQERVKEQLEIALEAARARGDALDHVLLVGPPGLGKTTLATIVREELGVGLRTIAGPALERKGDMAAILTGLDERDVLFVDEIHRLNRAIEEILYPALEDFRLDIVVGQGAAARTLTLDLPPFTLVGATTRTGLLTTPLRDRFGMTFRLGYYEPDELASIVRRSARILAVEIEEDAAGEIAARSRGTPRVANRILRRIRDVAQVRHAGAVTTEIAREALELLEVDEVGLERTAPIGTISRRGSSLSSRCGVKEKKPKPGSALVVASVCLDPSTNSTHTCAWSSPFSCAKSAARRDSRLTSSSSGPATPGVQIIDIRTEPSGRPRRRAPSRAP